MSTLDFFNVYISGNTTFIGNSARRDGGGVRAKYSDLVCFSGTPLLAVTQLLMVEE